MMSVVLGLVLVGFGALLVVEPTASLWNIVGIILIVVGALALLSVLAAAMLASGRLRSRWVSPAGMDGFEAADSGASLEETRRDAAADAAKMHDDGPLVSPDAPGRMEDDL
jgi:hypothetical protein